MRVSVPDGFAPERLRAEGYAFTPSARPREVAGRADYVVLTHGPGESLLADEGLEPEPAPLATLPEEEQRSLLGTLDPEEPLPIASAEEGPLAPQPACNLIPNTFCQYTGAGPCPQSIETMLRGIETEHPEVAHFIDLPAPTTREGRRVYALRIGRQSVLTGDSARVPQLFVVGALRAREWAGSGVALELARRLAKMHDGPGPENDWVRQLLLEQAVLFVPVANPDGYSYTMGSIAGSRDWQKNREPCTEEGARGPCGRGGSCRDGQVCSGGLCYLPGVDLGSNFAFNWRDTGRTCSDASYEGPAAASEPELQALDKLFLDDELPTAPGGTRYVTRFLESLGGFGNYVLYPDGLTEGADGELHSPCRTGSLTQENCQPPELAALRWLAGSEAAPVLHDQSDLRLPYKSDTIYRSLQATVGDPLSHYAYSGAIRDFDPDLDRRTLGVSVLMSNGPSGYFAECMDPLQWSDLVQNQLDLVRRILEQLRHLGSPEGVARAPELGDWIGRRVHRLRSDEHSGPADTYGPPRFWVDHARELPGALITPPPGLAAGANEIWDATGLYYRTVRWRPTADHVFPGWLRFCPATGIEGCEYALIDGGTGVDLCSPEDWPAADGWARVGVDARRGADDCYWTVIGRNPRRGGTATFDIVRVARDLGTVEDVHLDYSYRIEPSAFTGTGRVEVAVRRLGGSWVTVRTYPASLFGGRQPLPDNEPAATRIRTEHVDLPSAFDGAPGVEVRFRATGVRSTVPPNGFTFRFYDVALVGRPAVATFLGGCIDHEGVKAVDPPGTGDVFDVPVVSGVENPAVCVTETLGDAEVTSGEGTSYSPWGSVARWAFGGDSGFSNEAFFQSTWALQASRDTSRPYYGDFDAATRLAGSWTFEVPGLLIDARHPRTLIYTTGDPVVGWTERLQFRVTLDRRARSVPVVVWNLVRESDGVGANVTAGVVRSWFGENPVEVVQTGVIDQFWGRDVEHNLPFQLVDTIYDGCDIDGRLQFELSDYAEAPVPDWMPDGFDSNEGGTECNERRENLHFVQENLGHQVPGVVSIYLVRSWGTDGVAECAFDDGTAIIGETFDRGIVLAEDRMLGPNIVAHELYHFMTNTDEHCGDPPEQCIPNDLMKGGAEPGEPEATISERECRVLTQHYASTVP